MPLSRSSALAAPIVAPLAIIAAMPAVAQDTPDPRPVVTVNPEGPRPIPPVAPPPSTKKLSQKEQLLRRYNPLTTFRFPWPLAKSAKDQVQALKADEGAEAHWLQIIEIPLKRNPVSLDQTSDNSWVKGDKPKNRTIAEITLSPRKSVRISAGGEAEPELLHLAVRDANYGTSAKAPAGAITDSDIYCGLIKNGIARNSKVSVCFHDTDGDARFDRISPALPENITKPLTISLMLPSVELATPIAFTEVTGEDTLKVKASVINCGRDWDRPRFQLRTDYTPAKSAEQIDRLTDVALENLKNTKVTREQLKRSLTRSYGRASATLSPCRRGDGLDIFEGRTGNSHGKGHILASLDGLVISIGKKKDGAPVTLRGELPDALGYRLERKAIAYANSGLSAQQKRVATLQRFDRDTYIASGPVRLGSDPEAKPGELFSMPFEYGYRARLTQKDSIRTILTSRSLEEGTQFYGLPMKRSIQTVYGYGGGRYGSTLGGRPVGPVRGIDTQMNWCTPVQREKTKRVGKGKNKTKETVTYYDATCISQLDGKYTIVKGITPAFAINSMRHDASISTNDGTPQLEILESGDLGAPMRLVFKAEPSGGTEFLRLRQEIWFGDTMTGSRIVSLTIRSNGKVRYRNAGGLWELIPTKVEKGEVPEVSVRMIRPIKEGGPINVSAGTTTFWDQLRR